MIQHKKEERKKEGREKKSGVIRIVIFKDDWINSTARNKTK